MTDYFMQTYDNPLSRIRVDLGTDIPLVKYAQKTIQDFEIISMLNLYKIHGSNDTPFIHICNWKWRPHPTSVEIQHRRRETGDKREFK